MMRFLMLVLSLVLSLEDSTQKNDSYSHLTYSQVGYDTGFPKNAMIQATTPDFINPDATFIIKRIKDGKKMLSGKVEVKGEKWGKYWWKLDFSDCNEAGEYFFEVFDRGQKILESDKNLPIKIGKSMLWNESWYATALEHLHIRDGLSYKPEGGWKDCGSTLQEISSHAIMLNALCDLLDLAPERLSKSQKREIYTHLLTGADYVAVCQDKASELGFKKGAVVHEARENLKVVTGNVAKTSMILARISRLINEVNPEKGKEYKQRSIEAFKWIAEYGPVLHWDKHNDNFAITHGAPYGMKIPPKEWMTRDLVMMIWASLELYKAGETSYKKQAVDYAHKIMARQVKKDKAEEGLYGHFYTYDSFDFTEKANIHCGAWNQNYKAYNQGGHFPHYLIPMIEMCRIWSDHPDAGKWKKTVHDFAYGYFIPATGQNPFLILPAGYYKGEGLLNFSGWYHGHNKIFGYAAALSLEFDKMFNDPQFIEIAIGNLQWIAGLHSGIAGKNEESSASMIVGIGNRWKADWDAMRGTITNGFESDGQFKLNRPSLETDKPVVFGDEGGIHHPAGWISGLSRLIAIQEK
jgi:RNase P/RNase MRP subunit p29